MAGECGTVWYGAVRYGTVVLYGCTVHAQYWRTGEVGSRESGA